MKWIKKKEKNITCASCGHVVAQKFSSGLLTWHYNEDRCGWATEKENYCLEHAPKYDIKVFPKRYMYGRDGCIYYKIDPKYVYPLEVNYAGDRILQGREDKRVL